MTKARFSAFGGFSLEVEGVRVHPPSTQKAVALLAYLVVHAGRDIAREFLLELLWPDADPERARASLKTATWSIRRSLRAAHVDADAVLAAGKVSMRWIADTDSDAQRFVELANSPNAEKRTQAIDCYRGDFLNTNYEEWVIAERERFAAMYERLLAEKLETTPDPALAQQLLARNPYDELAWRVLIESELQAARPVTARVLVARCREALAEAGVQPSDDFEARFGNIVDDAPQAIFRLPFIGRERELATLTSLWKSAARGTGSVTVVEGEAGIGKTALLEYAQRIARKGPETIIARAVVDDPRTFGVWGELFERLSSVPFAKFAKTAGSEVVGRLADELWRHLPKAFVLLVDDAHALKGEAFAVLVSLARLASASGAAVIIATRPEGVDHLRTAFGAGTHHEIHLSPLTRDDVDAAMQRSLENSSDALVSWLYDSSEGHPYFLTSLVRALQDDGAIERGSGPRWTSKRIGGEKLALPRDLQRFIEVRLRARGTEAATLACALALDPAATTSDLVAVLDLGESRVMDAIDDLLALGLIQQPAGGPEFSFNHHLTAEVASTLLNSGRRSHIHAAFAKRLADATDREASYRRARHLDASDQSLDAAEAYLVSATRALEWFAWRDALARSEAGLKAVQKLDGGLRARLLAARLHLVNARARAAGGDDLGSLEPLEKAIDLTRELGERALLVEGLQLKSISALNLHRIDQSIEAATRASEVAQHTATPQRAAQPLTVLCAAYAHVPVKQKAMEAAHTALEIARTSGDLDVVAAAADVLLRAQIMWWDFPGALETAELGLAAARSANWVAEGAFRLTRGMLWYYLENYRRARDELHQARQVAIDEQGERRWLVSLAGVDRLKLRFFATYVLGMVAAAESRWDEAIEVAQELGQTNLFKASYMVRNNVLHLWVDALLGRSGPDDVVAAQAAGARLQEDEYEQGSILDFSACVDLTRARIAAAVNAEDAQAALTQALARVNQLANARPLECDRAFRQLAAAARLVDSVEIETTALRLAQEFRSKRQAAAGPLWAGVAPLERV